MAATPSLEQFLADYKGKPSDLRVATHASAAQLLGRGFERLGEVADSSQRQEGTMVVLRRPGASKKQAKPEAKPAEKSKLQSAPAKPAPTSSPAATKKDPVK